MARDTVLQLPVAHCELNPIELVWAAVKGHVAKYNKHFTMTEVQQQLTMDFDIQQPTCGELFEDM